jgi:hypothetical protein
MLPVMGCWLLFQAAVSESMAFLGGGIIMEKWLFTQEKKMAIVANNRIRVF